MLPSSFFLELYNEGARRGYADRALPHAPVGPAAPRRRLRRPPIARWRRNATPTVVASDSPTFG